MGGRRKIPFSRKLSLAWEHLFVPLALVLWWGRDESTHDARGVLRPVRYRRHGIDPVVFARVRARLSPAHAEAGVFGNLLQSKPLSLVSFGFALGVVFCATIDQLVRDRTPTIAIYALILAVIVLLTRWWATWIMPGRVASVRNAWIEEGYCPSCTYPLPASPDERGAFICSECGGAWRRPTGPQEHPRGRPERPCKPV